MAICYIQQKTCILRGPHLSLKESDDNDDDTYCIREQHMDMWEVSLYSKFAQVNPNNPQNHSILGFHLL